MKSFPMKSWAIVPAFLIAATLTPLSGSTAADADNFDGTWILQMPQSSIRGHFTETMTISHKDGVEDYKTVMMTGDKPSGRRYQATSDGKPYPFFDVVTGKKRGTVRLTQKKPWMEVAAFEEDDPALQGLAAIEHWLSNDGRSMTSVLKDKSGAVTNLLVWERQ